MTDLSKTMQMTKRGLDTQAHRMRLISENVANVDTPGYQRKLPKLGLSGFLNPNKPGSVTLDRSPVEQIHDPQHQLADADGFRPGSNVNVVMELAEAREAQRIYQANLKMFEQAKEMSSGLNELLRK